MVHRTSILFLAAILLISSVPSHGIAGDAVFSADAQRIYECDFPDSGPAVNEIDLKKNTIRTIPLAQLSKDEPLRGITCDSNNQLFCTTRSALWSLDPPSGKLTKIREAPPGEEFWRVAYNPNLKRVFVTTSEAEPLFMLKSPSELISVRMRRHPYPSAMVFAASGELFFAAYGDLWHGEIQDDEEQGEHYFSVVAYRYAPLAPSKHKTQHPPRLAFRTSA